MSDKSVQAYQAPPRGVKDFILSYIPKLTLMFYILGLGFGIASIRHLIPALMQGLWRTYASLLGANHEFLFGVLQSGITVIGLFKAYSISLCITSAFGFLSTIGFCIYKAKKQEVLYDEKINSIEGIIAKSRRIGLGFIVAFFLPSICTSLLGFEIFDTHMRNFNKLLQAVGFVVAFFICIKLIYDIYQMSKQPEPVLVAVGSNPTQGSSLGKDEVQPNNGQSGQEVGVVNKGYDGSGDSKVINDTTPATSLSNVNSNTYTEHNSDYSQAQEVFQL